MRLMLIPAMLMMVPNIGHSISHNTDLSNFEAYDDVGFTLIDGVSNGCFTNLTEVSDYARSKIQLSGMNYVDKEYTYALIVSAVGHRMGAYCQGVITVGLYTHIEMGNGVKGLVTIKEIGKTFQDVTFNKRVLDEIGLFFDDQR